MEALGTTNVTHPGTMSVPKERPAGGGVLADVYEPLGAAALISVRTAVDPVSPRRQVLRCEQEPACPGWQCFILTRKNYASCDVAHSGQ